MLLTNEEVSRYNKAVDSYKKGVVLFNNTNSNLNTKRNTYLTMWNNSVDSFMGRHIPRK